MDTFVTCLPGLEALLQGELRDLGIPFDDEPDGKPTGGIQLPRDPTAAARITRESAIATGVLWRVAVFRCRSLGELARKCASLPWGEALLADVPVCLRVHSRKSRLYHTGAIAERVADAINRSVGCGVVPAPKGDVAAAHPDDPVPIIVRFERDECWLSIDLAGVPLHRRGYRTEPGGAPLREDLAAALLRASGWQPGQPLLDPMCGAGTVVIEAARRAAGIVPGSGRPMAWQRTRLAQQVAATGTESLAPAPGVPLIVGSDRSGEQLERARRNAARAGVEEWIQWEQAPVGSAPWLLDPEAAPAGVAVVTHPPFGLRSGRAATLRPLHQTLGHAVQALPGPWSLAMLVQDRKLAYATGIRMKSAFQTRQAAHGVHAMVGEGPPAPA